MKLSANDIVLKILGLLLLTAAMLKGYQLITELVANNDLWSNRNFLIFTVEIELAMGIWLIPGVFRRIALLTANNNLIALTEQITAAIILDKKIKATNNCTAKFKQMLTESI